MLKHLQVFISCMLVWIAPLAVRAYGDDMPATLPDDDASAEAMKAEMPATLPDDSPARSEESSTPPIRFEASINAALSVPSAQNPDVAGFGFAVTYGAGWGEIPLALGVDFISVGSIGDADSQVDIELMTGTTRAERMVNTRLLHFDAWLRLQPAHYPVRPYAEGFIGAQLFQGKYLLRVGNVESERAEGDDWARNVGWGVGVEFVGLLNSAGSMSLTLGMRRVYGETVKVARPVVIGDERIQTRYAADTAVLLFMVGIGLHYELADPEPSHDFMGH
ncbi:MAG TPA: hypothetical protein VFN67_01215 [Polyangiales bacterium]|nr:hypothetical protein [Polyangiales bacterium]